jgi:hypothetical protein
VEVVDRIQQMLNDGTESEARELYFAGLAPLFDDFCGALAEVMDHETKQIDHNELWRRVRLSFEALNSLAEDAAE